MAGAESQKAREVAMREMVEVLLMLSVPIVFFMFARYLNTRDDRQGRAIDPTARETAGRTAKPGPVSTAIT
jgi:hypothetical protein